MHSFDHHFRQLGAGGIWVPGHEATPSRGVNPPPRTADVAALPEPRSDIIPIDRGSDVAELIDDVVVDLRTVRKVLGLGKLLCGALTGMALCAMAPAASVELNWSGPTASASSSPVRITRAAPDDRITRRLNQFVEERHRAHDMLRLALVLIPHDLEVWRLEVTETPEANGCLPLLNLVVECRAQKVESALSLAASLDALVGGASSVAEIPLASGAQTGKGLRITTRRSAAPLAGPQGESL